MPKEVGQFLVQKLKILVSAHARAKNVVKRDASGKRYAVMMQMHF